MALTIDLYDCELHELEDHVSNPQLPMRTLELYVEQMLKLIARQKDDDKAAESRSRRNRSKSDALDNNDAISITSSTTSSRPRRSRSRKQSESAANQRRSRKTSRSNRVDEEEESDDDDIELEEFVPMNTAKTTSVEYDWFSTVDMEENDDSSSEDPYLHFDPMNIDNDLFNTLLTDKHSTAHNKHKKSSKKKKKKKHKEKKKKKKKHKKKKKKKSENNDDDYMLSSDDDDYETWDVKHYEQRVASYTMSQLEKEQKSLERQIEIEQKKVDKLKYASDESETEELKKLSLEEIEAKVVSKLSEINTRHREDPSRLYCICKEPYDGTTQMICCDYCQEWYHLSCIGLSADKLQSVEQLKFKCPICNGANPNDITKHTNNIGASFDSPKSTPNPQHIVNGPHDNGHIVAKQKYERLIMEFQTRLKQCRNAQKKEKKEMNDRLNRAKRDIDEERKQRIAIKNLLENAKKKSDGMVKELGESFKHQKEKEAELVNKLKKLEANKKKYKDSASENKKKMKQLKEEHEQRLHELEDELIPTLNDKINSHKKKYVLLEEKYEQLQQQTMTQQQQTSNTLNSTYAQYNKMQQQLSNKSAEAAKLHNLNSQVQHKMDTLHLQAQQNHQQWESIAKVKDDKIERLKKQIAALQQQNNALRTNNNMPQQQQVIMNNSTATTGSNTPRPPSPIKLPPTPGYLKFNDLELEELKMCRELCQKLLEANLFQVEHMAARAHLTKELFVSWVTGMGMKSPTVINDLNQATMGTLPQLDATQHLSMNCIRLLLIEIRKQLENIAQDTTSHDIETINKVKSLLREFQTASQAYEQKMTEFKRIQHDRLLEGCRTQGSVLEMFVVVGTNENNEPKSEWINVTVCNFDGPNNRVLVRKSNDQTMAYAAIDAATLRLPENVQNKQSTTSNTTANNNNNNNNNAAPNTLNNNNATSQPASYWANNSNIVLNRTTSSSSSSSRSVSNTNTPAMSSMVPGMAFNTAQMNFNGIPAIPAFPAANNTILPPFNDLQANNIGNQHHISNTINTNNNISINGATTHDPIVIGDEDDNISSRKTSSSRKRKREDRLSSKHHHKKKKKSKHDEDDEDDDDSTESDDESSSDSDISSDSETDSDVEPRKKHKSKKKHKKSHKKRSSKKHKKSKKRSKSKKSKKKSDKKRSSSKHSNGRKRARSSSSKQEEDNRSVSISSTASTRKRRGTKRQLPHCAKSAANSARNGAANPHKKRKIDTSILLSSGSRRSTRNSNTDYDVIDGGGDSDKNDSVCRICKHPGDLVCCEGCPSAYHTDCIRPRVKPEWLDKFDDWFCPSCAPRWSYIPLKYRKSGEKWPQNKEPLLKDLKEFLKRHPLLERDYDPTYHESRKQK